MLPQRLLVLSVIALSVSTAAYAYVPPTQYIVKMIARKHTGYKRIVVKTNVALMENGQPGSVHFQETTAYFPATGTLKSWASDEKGQKLYEVERKAHDLLPGSSILFDSNPTRLTETLKTKGIAIQTEAELLAFPTEDERRASEKSTLNRWNKTVAWVVGTRDTKSSSAAQLWVEKDVFLPMRFIAPLQADSSDISDLEMENYRFSNEFPYPRQITWMKGKNPYLRADVAEIGVDTGPDLSRAAVSGGWTDAGNRASSSLRDLVRTYYSVLR